MSFFGVAYAAQAFAQEAAKGGETASLLANPLVIIIPMFAIVYFLIFRPQQKKQKELKAMLSNLKKGDLVFTIGGMHGKITGLTDMTVTLEVADRVRIKLNRSAIGGLLAKGEVLEKEKEPEKE